MKEKIKSIRFSEEENNKLMEGSERLNLTPSEYIRLALAKFWDSNYSKEDRFEELKIIANENTKIMNKAKRIFICHSGNIFDAQEYFYEEAECIALEDGTDGKDMRVLLFNKEDRIMGKFYISKFTQVELKEKISPLEIDVVYINKI